MLKPYDVHIWYMYVPAEPVPEWLDLLSPDEKQRAMRFHFPIHRDRFIAARANLRILLGQYENLPPEQISFSYNEFGKPFLQDTFLQFNVSHSHDMVVYAFTLHHRVGVDIEKVEDKYDDHVAKRFFSENEYRELDALSASQRLEGFYKIWAKKEALIKATGLGMKLPLQSFSVSLDKAVEDIMLQHEVWQMHYLQIDSGYQAAMATEQKVREILLQEI